MSTPGYETACIELLKQHHIFGPSLVFEEIVEAIEADDHIIVHRSQVRSREELLRALQAEKQQ